VRAALALFLLCVALARAQPLAITNVTVIDATGAPARVETTVIVEGDRITSIGQSVPSGARVVDGKGRFLIPGLWDMHVHWEQVAYLPLFTANGVTGVRMMWGQPHHLQWRRDIEVGTLIGPRLAIAGTIVDGPKPYWKGSIATSAAEDGREAVRRTRADGYDFVKVYNSLSRETFFAIIDEAKKLGMPVAGHVPTAVRMTEASDAGMKSIEHLTLLLLAVTSRESELRVELDGWLPLPEGPERQAAARRYTERMLASYDNDTAAALFAKLRANGTWQVPTFSVLRPRHAAMASDPRLKYMPPWVRKLWAGARNAPPGALPERIFERRLTLVGEMHRAGVPILAGSDVLNPYCFPGFSLHDELAWLVKAGLSPMAALQAATRDAGRFLDRADLGTVEEGKLADLVLLEADPLADIRNTQKIAAVISRGKYYGREDLDRMLGDVERLARSE
jgi:imidazolonepropionase-like amidohydrolase